ncbi:MAG: DUF4296 domain-containing protein [Flavobacteriaceae bacterium]
MRILVFLCCMICWVGCQEVSRPPKPDNLIGKEKMIDILTDAYTGNAAKSINNRTLRQEGISLDSLVFNKYQIDSAQFANSNAYYSMQMNEYIDILTQVNNRLKAQKALVDTAMAKEGKNRKDSLDALRESRKEQRDSLIEASQLPPAEN